MAKSTEDPPHKRADRLRSLVNTATGMQASFTAAGSVMAASYTLIAAIVLLGAVGYFADRWLDTDLARVIWSRTP